MLTPSVLLYLCTFLGAGCLGFAKFLSLEKLMLMNPEGDVQSYAQQVGVYFTLGPAFAFFVSKYLLQRWSPVAVMPVMMLSACLLLSSLVLDVVRVGEPWLSLMCLSLSFAIFGSARSAAMVPLAESYGLRSSAVNAKCTALFIAGLLLGSPLGTWDAQRDMAQAQVHLVLMMASLSLFSGRLWMVSTYSFASDRAASSTAELMDDSFVGDSSVDEKIQHQRSSKAFSFTILKVSPFALIVSSLLWAVAGVLSLEMTGLLMSSEHSSDVYASSVGAFAAVGVALGVMMSSKFRGALSSTLAPVLVALALVWTLGFSTLKTFDLQGWGVALNTGAATVLGLMGLGFGWVTNHVDVVFLKACERENLRHLGSPFHSLMISMGSVLLGAFAAQVHSGSGGESVYLVYSLILMTLGVLSLTQSRRAVEALKLRFMLLACGLMKLVLSWRYRVRVTGDAQALEGLKGALFLPNHPAEVDPLLLSVHLWPKTRFRPVVTSSFYRMPWVGSLVKAMGAYCMEDLTAGAGRVKVKAVQDCLQTISSDWSSGDAVMMYPAGRLMRSAQEDCRSASGAYTLLSEHLDAPVVLVRTKGLWGSRFSTAATKGRTPDLWEAMRSGVWAWFKAGAWFAAKREIRLDVKVFEKGLPRFSDVKSLNEHLNAWYNGIEEPSLCTNERADLTDEHTSESKTMSCGSAHWDQWKELILEDFPREGEWGASASLLEDIGMDSIEMSEWLQAVEERCGVTDLSSEGLECLGDVADRLEKLQRLDRSEDVSLQDSQKKDMSSEAQSPDCPSSKSSDGLGACSKDETRLEVKADSHLVDAFFETTQEYSKLAFLSDSTGDQLTGEQAQLAVWAMSAAFKSLEGERVGVMLPASKSSGLVMIALLLAGKTPVFFNWTTGSGPLKDAWIDSGARVMISSERFIDKLNAWPLEEASVEWLFLEKLKTERLSKWELACAKLKSWCPASWFSRSWAHVNREDTAVVLFTSGSESKPKGVPLSHGNILSDLKGAVASIDLHAEDALLAFLPPFHSFGLSVTTLLPLVSGLKAVYHPNPMDSRGLVKAIAKHDVSIVLGTPTFLQSLLQVSKSKAFEDQDPLSSLRLLVAGAEKVPVSLRETVASYGENMVLLEGYGITECAPVITLQRPSGSTSGVGEPIEGVRLKIVDLEKVEDGRVEECSQGQVGMILVSGENVFSGYLQADLEDPFVADENGKRWYKTGDLGRVNERGELELKGRLKRFVKIAGEMISLPALEEALREVYPSSEGAPSIAVEVLSGKSRAELYAMATLSVSVEDLNRCLKEKGFSNLSRLKGVHRLEEMPLLGSGKVDQRQLGRLLKDQASARANSTSSSEASLGANSVSSSESRLGANSVLNSEGASALSDKLG